MVKVEHINGDVKLVTKGAFESIFKPLGYKVVVAKEKKELTGKKVEDTKPVENELSENKSENTKPEDVKLDDVKLDDVAEHDVKPHNESKEESKRK